MRRQAILKIAEKEMLQHGTSCISLQRIQERTGIPEKTFHSLFPEGDKELLLDTMEYSGKEWVRTIRRTLRTMQVQKRKVEFFVDSYCLGTQKHPSALDTYLDMWKAIKDTGDEYLRARLASIYQMYIASFLAIVKEDLISVVSDRELYGLAFMATVLSDALHVQIALLKQEIPVETVTKLLKTLLWNLINGKGADYV